MPRIIVFSGHGSWELGDDEFVTVPAKCTIKFYTLNMKTLSDGLGGDIDRGRLAGLEPDQVNGPRSTIPDMRLFPPINPTLNIRQPPLATWHVLKLPAAIPTDTKNLQIQIQNAYTGGASLKVLFELLQPAIDSTDQVTFLWAACRAINLKERGGESIGVNAMQR